MLMCALKRASAPSSCSPSDLLTSAAEPLQNRTADHGRVTPATSPSSPPRWDPSEPPRRHRSYQRRFSGSTWAGIGMSIPGENRDLERRFRRLLRLFPAHYRRVWEEELIAVLM